MKKQKLKIEFQHKETGEYVSYETMLGNVKVHDILCFTNEINGDEYAYPLGGFRIYQPAGNVICAREVELDWLRIESNFE